MMNRTENEVRKFDAAINECKRPVWLVSSEGTAYNMKSAAEHDAAMAKWINDTNDEMEIFTNSCEDEAVMMGFWQELVAAARKELKPPAMGFFSASPNGPLQGALVGNQLELRCENRFIADTIGKPEILEIVSRKASSLLSRPVQAAVVDLSAKPAGNARLEQLMNFGKAHPDVVKIRNN